MYKFARNARHNFMLFVVGRTPQGQGMIASIFNANIRTTESGYVESIRFYERNEHLDITQAVIYEPPQRIWSYPEGLAADPSKKPDPLVMELAVKIPEAVEMGICQVHGNANRAQQVLAGNMREFIADLKPSGGKLLTFASPPEASR